MSVACNWSDFDSAKMATFWSCKSPFSSTANRPTEPHKFIVGTLRNTTECRARPAQRPNHRVSGAKSIVVIEIHGQALDLLPLPPRMNKQSAGAADDARHVVTAIHGCRVIGHIL